MSSAALLPVGPAACLMASIEVARRVRVPISDAEVRKAVRAVIARVVPSSSSTRPSSTSVSVAFVSPRTMRRLNRTYHGEDRVTDVLSFGSSAAEQQRSRAKRKRGPAANPDLGELVICPSYVKAQAQRAGEPFRRELTRVLIHGTLHLLGFDHWTPQDAETMFSIQERLIQNSSLGHKRES